MLKFNKKHLIAVLVSVFAVSSGVGLITVGRTSAAADNAAF